MIVIGIYLLAVTVFGVWLDRRVGRAACDNERPSTAVAAWSWLGLPIVILIAAAA